MKKFLILFIIFLLSFPAYAFENLTELEYRRDNRKGSNTFYSGESAGNDYLWQPQTVCYIDTTYGTEVWIMTSTKNINTFSGQEYAHNPWSADGKKFALRIDMDTDAFTRGEYTNNDVWFTLNSDGTKMRPRVGSPARIATHAVYTNWSPTIPDVFYEFGRHYAAETGYDYNKIYKCTVSDENIITPTSLVDLIAANTTTELDFPKQAIGPDGKYAVATRYAEATAIYVPNLIAGTISANMTGYNIDRSLDTYWGDTAAYTSWHDEMLVGNDDVGYWLYFLIGNTWWRQRLWGTDDDAPNHTADTSDPFDWWEGTTAQQEIQPLSAKASYGNSPRGAGYWSHGSPDRWGRYVIHTTDDSDDCGDCWKNGPGIWDVTSGAWETFCEVKGGQYYSWTAWSDIWVGTSSSNILVWGSITDACGEATNKGSIVLGHSSVSSVFSKPGQSPDGTKASFRSNWLNSTGAGDVLVGVVYYPYPPEIISVSSGVVRFDWRTEGTSRGYTQRGWPNESVDDPPPPRETKEFRLWKSANGTTGWEHVGKVTANPFDKFDFVDGGLKSAQVAYWEITDPSPSGYYAVTAIEHSGLESRTLSNVFSAAGSQTAAYPSDPGGDDDITSTYSEDLYRHTDIVADDDGAIPTDTQQMRIASIAGNPSSFVDWLGKSDDSTLYRIIYVDTQGNRSALVTPTIQTDTPNAGQYTLTDMDYDEEEGSTTNINGMSFSGSVFH